MEFALLSPLLLGLILCITETGFTFLFGLSLENASQKLARMMQTGQLAQLGVASAADLKNKVICPAAGGGLLPGFIDCSRLVVDLRSAASYSVDPSNDFYKQNPIYCPAGAGQVFVLRLAYGMPVFLPPLALGNAVFAPSTAGIVDDYPGGVGWTHLLANAVKFQMEGDGSSNSASSSASPPPGC